MHPPDHATMLQLRSAKRRLAFDRPDVANSLRRLGTRVAGRLPLGRRGHKPRATLPPIRRLAGGGRTEVDRYWSGHTVRAASFANQRQSQRFLEWRFEQYPLFREFSGLWGDHDRQVVLDYGCGPGNDLVGFALYTHATRIVGIDVSARALELARERLALHRVHPERVELIMATDGEVAVPLEDGSCDFFQSQGVLHHVSDPGAILRELARVLKVGGEGTVMVYNRHSVWFNLYTAYERMIVENAFPGDDVHEAFRRNTDGPECPISRSYAPEEFAGLCRAAGFDVEYVGGYLSNHELNVLDRSWARAIADARLAPEHRGFLRALTYDFAGRPMHEGLHAGIGGTYRLRKP
jgi:SAM-dependent methyltransferase